MLTERSCARFVFAGETSSPARPPMQTVPPLPLKRRVLYALERALYWSGAGFAYTSLGNVAGATVLMYHSVADNPQARFVEPAMHMSPATFEAQVRWLAEHRHVVSLDTLVERLSRGEATPAGTVVLTFDDGYLDNLEVAAPILAKYHLPATLYLATGYVEDGETQWVDHLYTAFRSRRRQRLELEGLGRFDLSDPAARLDAYQRAGGHLIEISRPERQDVLHQIREQLRPEELPPRLTMTWDDVRRLAADYPRFELGVHTVDHLDLSKVDEATAEAQMVEARDQIEAVTGTRPRHFSFPYSRTTPAATRLAEKVGFASATGPGTEFLIGADADRYDLSRIDPKMDEAMLRFCTSGAYPALPKRLFRRA